jgi:O-antigen/teichoic acid export membrane protein
MVARNFGSTVVGLLAMINSIFTIASIFTLFGTNTSILRLYPEVMAKNSTAAAREVQRRIHLLVLYLSPIVSLVTIGVGLIWEVTRGNDNGRVQIFFIAAAILPMYSLARLSTETLRAQQHIRLYALAHVLPALTNFLFLLLFILVYPRPEAPIIALISSALVVFLLTRSMAFHRSPEEKGQSSNIGTIPSFAEIVRLSLPMGTTLGMQLLLSNQDLLLIGFLRSEGDAGVYSIASKLSALTSFIITSINAVSAARFSQLFYSNQKPELLRLAKKSSSLIFWTSLPILLVLIFFGKYLLGIFGNEFTVGYTVLVVLVSGEFVNAVGGSVGLYLNMTGSHKEYRNIVTFAAIINAIANLVLIPRIGILGAGIASLISVSMINISASYLIYRRTGSCISYVPTWIRDRINL